MKLKITADCWDESDLHYFYPKSQRKPMLEEGQEFLYDGEEYKNFYGVWYVLHLPAGTYYIDPRKAQIGGDIPAWVTVDENGTETKHYAFKPVRILTEVLNEKYFVNPTEPVVKDIYWWGPPHDCKQKCVQHGKKVYVFEYRKEVLEPGTIEQLIGRKLTYKDDPVQIQ